MHQYFSGNFAFDGNEDIIYETESMFAHMSIFFVSDHPHLIKTLRDCLFKSGSSASSKLIWNNEFYLL